MIGRSCRAAGAVIGAALLSVAPAGAFAQAAPAAQIPPPAIVAVADPSQDAAASVLIAPILLDRSNRLTLPVTVGTHGPYGFVVDTGSERTVVSQELASSAGLVSAGRARVVGLAEAVMANLYHLDTLKLRDLVIPGITVPAFDEQNIGAPGLIGIDSLENHRLVIDFIAGRMDIRPSPRTRVPRREAELDDDAIVVTARRRVGRMILSNATLGGQHIDVVIDTGAQASVGNLALRRLVGRQPGQSRRDLTKGQLTSITGGTLAVEVGQINRISVGGVDFTALPVVYADSPAFATLGLGRRPTLLLGMDVLRLFDRIVVDFTNRRVTFDLPASSGRGGPGRYAGREARPPG